ncbi:conserved hypothetical protein [Methylocella tundrae]|jgi:hypothetical protein|uniref:Uncharacterized protein n=1 Tax=Methylocella tundrae TaxID=227605 RepID=A0A8B6M348_METTU|nr:hypothetical protein [Methylocella tundrae]VTZ21465.1 conserved hypothetical protein [Methylocella tundrae]VTZ49175.1 conserved hypothetical protein [Methylocella tundrae]
MKESQIIHIPSDASQEAVALTLLQLIVCAEGKKFDAYFGNGVLVDRKWLLDTYAECLSVIKNPVERKAS